MSSTCHIMIRFLILVLAIAQRVFADPADAKFLSKAFVPVVKPLRSAAIPSHTIAQVPVAAAGNIGTIDQGAISKLRAEKAIAKPEEENKVMTLEFEHLRAQIQQMKGLQGQKQTPTDGQADMAAEEPQYLKLLLGVGAIGLGSVAAYSFIKNRASNSPLSGRRMAPLTMALPMSGHRVAPETSEADWVVEDDHHEASEIPHDAAHKGSANSLLELGYDLQTRIESNEGRERRVALQKSTFLRPDKTILEPPKRWQQVHEELWTPDRKANMRIEGGKTIRTFKMPRGADRVQYILTSPGSRPVKGKVEMWIGPICSPHMLIHDSVDGKTFPVKATVKFKPLQAVLKITTHGDYAYPLQFGVFVPGPEESKKIGDITDDFFNNAPLKETVQGGDQKKEGGQIRSFKIPNEWKKTQIMLWATTNLEVLQGPNTVRQHFNLRSGLGPFHAVIDTPGSNWSIRLNSRKYLEDGDFEVALGPYGELDFSEEGPSSPLGALPMGYGPLGNR